MTPQAQRIAIAEARGWKRHANGHFYLKPPIQDGGIVWCDSIGCKVNPPDYPTDLNAMHEAEKVLTPKQCEMYYGLLATAPYNRAFGLSAAAWQAHATAAQRAEAFLRTVGKWDDSK